ncbi:hypothetical protein AWC38_SpisGene19624 [Stylophora pistillata]|uniref:Uncharacterized protein n=1 Tax=Stylophora pistillata TaxID=50429 RepID=A0A2B4RH36_STYPI|nr:hypothetical protein AWC38_SpisGene19624 [Stylophora pistillata]
MPTTPMNKTSSSVVMTPPDNGNSQRAENKNVSPKLMKIIVKEDLDTPEKVLLMKQRSSHVIKDVYYVCERNRESFAMVLRNMCEFGNPEARAIVNEIVEEDGQGHEEEVEDDHHEREERFDAKRGAALTPAESQCGLGAASEAFLEAALFETEVLRERRRARVADEELSDPEDTAETGDLRWPGCGGHFGVNHSSSVVGVLVMLTILSLYNLSADALGLPEAAEGSSVLLKCSSRSETEPRLALEGISDSGGSDTTLRSETSLQKPERANMSSTRRPWESRMALSPPDETLSSTVSEDWATTYSETKLVRSGYSGRAAPGVGAAAGEVPGLMATQALPLISAGRRLVPHRATNVTTEELTTAPNLALNPSNRTETRDLFSPHHPHQAATSGNGKICRPHLVPNSSHRSKA